jgi:hypothetical protein
MLFMFPSLRIVYVLELRGLNVRIEKECVLSEVRSKFFYNLNESLFPRVGIYIYHYSVTLSFILIKNRFVLIFLDYRYLIRYPGLV